RNPGEGVLPGVRGAPPDFCKAKVLLVGAGIIKKTKYTFGYGLKVEKLGWRAESPRVSGTITEITQRNLLCIYPLLYSSQFYSSPSA
ncbi:GSCOCG00009868001-RA-CDS, partial [Cotesia congregata]